MHPSRNELEKKNGRFIGRCLNENANQAGNFSRDKYTHVTFCAPTSVKLNPESADYIRSKYYGASSLSSLSCCCPLRSLRYIIPRRFVFTLSWGMHRQRVSDGHDPYSTPRIFFRKFRRSNFSKFQIPSFSFSLVSLFEEGRRKRESRFHSPFLFFRLNLFSFDRVEEGKLQGIVNLYIIYLKIVVI